MYATVYCGESFNTKITNIDRISLGSKDVGRSRGVFSIDLDPWVLCKAVWVEVQNPVGLRDGWEAKGSCAICRFEIYESVGNDFGVIMGKDTEDSSGIYKEEFSSLVSNPTWTTNAKRHTSILPTFNRNPNNLVDPDKKSRLLEKVQAFHQDVALKQRLDEPLYFGGRLGSGSLDKRILASHYFGGRLDGDTTKTFVNMANAFDKDLSTGVTIAGTTNVGDNNGMLIGRHFETDQPFSKIVLKASIDTQSLIEHPTGVDKIDMTFVVKVGHSQDSENGVEIGRLELKDVPSKATPPPLFVLTKTSSTYDIGVKECASIHSLWKYIAADINTVQEMTDVAQLLTDKDVDKAYIGAKEQYTGLPRWKWENKDAPGSTWKYLEEPMTVPPGCWNDVDKKATGDGTTTADPKSQIGQYLSDATMYNRITVSKTSPKGWSDASIGIDILPMVCRRQQATVTKRICSTPCGSGTRFVACSTTASRTCPICDAGSTWQDSTSHKHAGCKACSVCAGGTTTKTECTATVDRQCTGATCTCPNGTPAISGGSGGTLCEDAGSVDCSACDDGYTISSKAGIGSVSRCNANTCRATQVANSNKAATNSITGTLKYFSKCFLCGFDFFHFSHCLIFLFSFNRYNKSNRDCNL